MNQSEFISIINTESTDHPDADKLIKVLDKANNAIFQGKDEPQPIKIYQVRRIFVLAQTCIDLLVAIWPYIRIIISLFSKKK